MNLKSTIRKLKGQWLLRCSVLLGIIASSLQLSFRATRKKCDGHNQDADKQIPKSNHSISACPEASQLRLLCRDKSGNLVSTQLRPSLLADTSSNMNMPLHQLKIEVHPLPTIALLLALLAVALLLTVLSGELRQFQWLLLATSSGSLLESFRITFGGTLSCVVMPNDKSSGTREEKP